MVNFFLRLYDMLYQRRALFTGLLLGLIMTLLVMMFSLTYNENIYDFLPLSGNEQKAINIYQDISGGQRIYAMFKTKDSQIDRDRLAEAVDSFALKINSQSGKMNVIHKIINLPLVLSFQNKQKPVFTMGDCSLAYSVRKSSICLGKLNSHNTLYYDCCNRSVSEAADLRLIY